MQRFLTESPWDDNAVIGRLQEYLSPRLGHPEAVWVLDGSDFPKQGRKPAGVARQYCGRLGKVANYQAGMFLAYVSPLGRRTIAKSGSACVEAVYGLRWAEGVSLRSQGHGHTGWKPSFQAQRVQPGVDQNGEDLTQPRTA